MDETKIGPLREQGWSDTAIHDAIQVIAYITTSIGSLRP
jgi:hypothetical protein